MAGFIIIVSTTVVLAAVIAAFVFGMTGPTQPHHNPVFTAEGYSNSTIIVILENMGDAKSIKRLVIQQPSISNRIIIDPDTDIVVGQRIKISDQNLTGRVHLVASSMVDGKEQVVINYYI